MEKVFAALREPDSASSQRGRDGMSVDVILRDGSTTRRRRFLTTEGDARALGALYPSVDGRSMQA